MDDLLQMTVSVIVTFLGIMAAWALRSLRLKLEHEKSLSLLEELEMIACMVVRDLEQTVVRDFKSGGEQMTKEQGSDVKEVAVNTLVRYLKGSLPRDMVASAVEAAVHGMKVEVPPKG